MSTQQDDTHHDRRRRRGIYLLPNIFTTGTLFAGFYAIVAATQQRFELAAAAVFAAMITDMLDGRVARLTHTESEFGVQYDSLADLVAFGLAPGLIAYLYSLESLSYVHMAHGKLGWVAAFFYTACAGLRLARFNVHAELADSHVFFGLPSPSAAALVAGFVLLSSSLGADGTAQVVPMLLLTIGGGALMVSNIRYNSFKHLKFAERVPFAYIILLVLAFVLISLDPPRVLFYGFFLYALSGPVSAAWRWFRPG